MGRGDRARHEIGVLLDRQLDLARATAQADDDAVREAEAARVVGVDEEFRARSWRFGLSTFASV